MSEPFRRAATGVTLRIRVTPNAGADRIEGLEVRDDGDTVLKLRVAAVPDKGKANAAAIALLAKALGVPKSGVTLVAGDTSRLKTLAIAGDPPIAIAEQDGTTVQTFHQARLPTRSSRDDHVHGWNGSFDKLAGYAAGILKETSA